jgi:xylan 1,4-beta-xylosidase
MSTYMVNDLGTASGALVFDTLDFLVTNGIIPTIEIGFMPEALAINSNVTVFHYKGGASTYANSTKWFEFVNDFVSLLVSRYGLATVQTFFFEVWNEPNCGFFVETNCCGDNCGNQTAYFELYNVTSRAVKAVDASLRVGGPSTAQLAWIPELIAFTKSSGAPIDFVSSHLYPTDPFLNHTRDAFSDAVANASNIAKAAGVPFLLTEFNAGLGKVDGVPPLLDSSYAAAFLLHSHLMAQLPAASNIESMSWWTFTDFGFEEQGVDPLPWNPAHTKFGVQTSYGVKKPAYRAMQYISDPLASQVVPVTADVISEDTHSYVNSHGAIVGATSGTIDLLIAVSGTTVTALINNFQLALATPLPVPTNVTITFTSLTAPLPIVGTVEYLDANHTNPMNVWIANGSPMYPSTNEIALEETESLPTKIQINLTPVSANAVSATILMTEWSFARLRFTMA